MPRSRSTDRARADAEVAQQDPEERARAILLRRLSAAPRTRKDLADGLARRGIPEEVAAPLLDRFTEIGLIDDAEYARAWTQSRHRSRGSTRVAIRHELTAKGVAREAIDEALTAVDDDAERERGARLVRSRLRSTAHLEPAPRARRLVNVLARRGYAPGTAYAIVREILGEFDTSDGHDAG